MCATCCGCTGVYVCVCMCVYVYVYVHLYVCLCVNICTYFCMHVRMCMYIYVRLCMCVCMYMLSFPQVLPYKHDMHFPSPHVFHLTHLSEHPIILIIPVTARSVQMMKWNSPCSFLWPLAAPLALYTNTAPLALFRIPPQSVLCPWCKTAFKQTESNRQISSPSAYLYVRYNLCILDRRADSEQTASTGPVSEVLFAYNFFLNAFFVLLVTILKDLFLYFYSKTN